MSDFEVIPAATNSSSLIDALAGLGIETGVAGGALTGHGPSLHVVTTSTPELTELAWQLESNGANVLRLDSSQGARDITNWLDQQETSQSYDQISIYSHGSSGKFSIGGDIVSYDNLTGLRHALEQIGKHVSNNGDLLIYGCSVGSGADGERLIHTLADITGADIAASTDRSGSLPGSDWDLELTTGDVADHAEDLHSRLTWQGSLDLPGVAPAAPGITPNASVTSALYYDANGDVVDIRLNGPGSFRIGLSGGQLNNADATSLILSGTTASSSLSVSVIPIELPMNAGSILQGTNGLYNRMYSSGYTSISSITTDNPSSIAALSSLMLSGAIVNSIDLPNLDIGNITLDAGYAPYVDRINTSSLYNSSGIQSSTNFSGNSIDNNSNNQAEVVDFAGVNDDQSHMDAGAGGGYRPVTGLIDLGDVIARSIGSLIVNGSISASTSDPFDRSALTNDIRGKLVVSGRIGSIEGQRSRLDGSISAASIGSIDLGRIDGNITTSDATQSLTVKLPYDYQGFLKSAGHLNLAYTFEILAGGSSNQDFSSTLGEIRSLGGISGILSQVDDVIYVPDQYVGVVVNQSSIQGIADISINGVARSRWISSQDIGSITANGFSSAMLVEAAGDIGNIELTQFSEVVNPEAQFPPEPGVLLNLSGTFKAGASIGHVKSATGVDADLSAGQDIGDITSISGGLSSNLIIAGGSIGDIWLQSQLGKAAKIVATTGSIGDLYIATGDWDGSLSADKNIGDITLAKGGLNQVKISAGGSIGNIKISASTGAIVGGSIVAGDDIGAVEVSTSTGSAINGALIQAGSDAGDRISSIHALSYGATILPPIQPGLVDPPVSDNSGIQDSQILAAELGVIDSRAHTGIGIVDSAIHAQRASLDGIIAKGNTGGLVRVTAVAEQDIGPVEGYAEVQGSGIAETRINANTGSIGVVKGQGGLAGGDGISSSYLQAASDITGIRGTSNANQGHAINTLTATANTYGSIIAKVLGGEGTEPLAPPPPFPQRTPTGSGIVDSYFKGNLYDANDTKPGIEAIIVDVRSLYGQGINNSQFSVKDTISSISVTAYNNTAIVDSDFSTSRGVIGGINAEATHKGRAIMNSTFDANNGDIGLLGGIVAKANGAGITDHAIEAATFTASNGIGAIQAITKGGTAILGSTFMADTDLSGSGRIVSIAAKTGGLNLADSMGISGSNFNAADIGTIRVDVDEFEGGAAISGSEFTARTATYDGLGNFDNNGSIGDITIDSLSRVGNGIESSSFLAGAGGSIGNISVDLISRKLQGVVDGAANGASGKGIYLSRFQASSFDYDQNVWDGKIGDVTIKAGRVIPTLLPAVGSPPNDQLTAAAAGVDLSYFAAYGGIGNITIDTIGTGIFGSAFLADFDIAGLTNAIAGTVLSTLAAPVAGNIGNITIRTNGRFAVGSAASLFTGAGIGNIDIEANALNVQTSPVPTLPTPNGNPVLALIESAFTNIPLIGKVFSDVIKANNRFGLAAVVGTAFAATENDIGSIRVTNTGATGLSAIASAFLAKKSFGPKVFTPGLETNWGGDLIAYGIAYPVLWALGFTLQSAYSQAGVFFAGSERSGTVPGGTTPLYVALVAVPASSSSTAYKIGAPLNFTVNFDAPVQVSGTPTLGITVGGVAREATYSSGSGTSRLVFTYLVQEGDLSQPEANPVTLADQLTTTNGTVRFVNSNTPIPVVTVQPLGDPAALVVDGVAAKVVSATNNIAQLPRQRAAGNIVELNVTFDEAVNVQGTPYVNLTIGKRVRRLTYTRGAGTSTLQFRYTLTSQDLQGLISINDTSINLGSNASITDLAGNNATLTLVKPQALLTVQSALSTAAPSSSASKPAVSSSVATVLDPVSSGRGKAKSAAVAAARNRSRRSRRSRRTFKP